MAALRRARGGIREARDDSNRRRGSAALRPAAPPYYRVRHGALQPYSVVVIVSFAPIKPPTPCIINCYSTKGKIETVSPFLLFGSKRVFTVHAYIIKLLLFSINGKNIALCTN